MFGDKSNQEVGENKKKTSGGGSVRGFTDEIKNASKNSKKINIKLNSCTKLKNAFDVKVEEARSKNNSISSTSSNDEGISKTPKNLTKNFQNLQNFQKNQDKSYNELNSVSSVESAFTNQIDDNSISEFSATSFQKRLFGRINKKNFPAVSFHKHWASIQINDFMLVEMTPFSLQNGGRDAFNDFLDDCYDDDSICKLVVYFDESNNAEFDTMKTTFSTMDFCQMTACILTKMLGEKLAKDNFYMVMDCAITTSDEDFSGDESVDEEPDLIIL